MLLVQAYREMQANPDQRYQVFVQHPQNWPSKGWISVFKDDGSPACQLREMDKHERFIGIFDCNIEEGDFYLECTQACLAYRFSVKRDPVWIDPLGQLIQQNNS